MFNLFYKVSFNKTAEDSYYFTLDIANAYQKEAQVNSWIRTFQFNATANKLMLIESYELEKCQKPFELHFVTALHDIDQSKKGKLILTANQGKTSLLMQFDEQLFDVRLEQHPTDDLKLFHAWGHHVTRVTLVSKITTGDKCLKGQFKTLFQMM